MSVPWWDQEDPTSGKVGLVHVPVSLLPAMAISRALFREAEALAEPFNALVEAVASQSDVLRTTLRAAADQDDFTREILEIHRQVLAGPRPHVARRALAINRSDYMVDLASNNLLQIELNTISSSFGAQSTLMAQMHRQILDKHGSDLVPGRSQVPQGGGGAPWFAAELMADQLRSDGSQPRLESCVPYKDTIGDIVDTFATAVGEYSQQRRRAVDDGSSAFGEDGANISAFDESKVVVLMVVQEGERNVMDQQILEQELWRRHGVRMVRRTLAEVRRGATLSDREGVLTLDDTQGGGAEVAVTYLRAGYAPTDYPTRTEWEARLMLEQSLAFKCPSIAYQLVGSKKIQQYLAESEVLERFVSEADAKMLRKVRALSGLPLVTPVHHHHLSSCPSLPLPLPPLPLSHLLLSLNH